MPEAVLGFEFRSSGVQRPGCMSKALGVKLSAFRVSGFRFRALSFRFRVSGFVLSGFECRVPGFEFQVSNFGLRISDFGSFGLRISGFGFRISDFGFRTSAFGFRISGFAFRVLVFWLRVPGQGACSGDSDARADRRDRQEHVPDVIIPGLRPSIQRLRSGTQTTIRPSYLAISRRVNFDSNHLFAVFEVDFG